MKVEFLNDDLTEARVTRSWFGFRKRVAHVRKRTTGGWIFASTGRSVGGWTKEWILAARDKVTKKRSRAQRDNDEWVPVAKVPEARLLRDGQ